MRLSIIPIDGAVIIDGVAVTELSLPNTVPNDVHALQWYDTEGEIEYISRSTSNEDITELPSWANDCVSAHTDAIAQQDSSEQ